MHLSPWIHHITRRGMNTKAQRLKNLRGMRDLLPAEYAIYKQVHHHLRDGVEKYGYQEMKTPILESTSLFRRLLGTDSDIVQKEMYTFEDKSQNSITLRPEGTAGVAKAIINAGKTFDLPQKLYYLGDMYRYERPQKGRYREFQQFGVELLGVDSPLADVEVIAMAAKVLKKCGLFGQSKLHINTLGDSESRHQYEQKLQEYFEKFRADLSRESQLRLEHRNPLRILDSKADADEELIQGAPAFAQYLSVDARTRFDMVLSGLDSLSIDYYWDQKLVRGLDYYSHTAFEFLSTEHRFAYLAGGRYDELFSQLGAKAIPAIGWAAGIDRLCLHTHSSLALETKQIAMVPVDSDATGKVAIAAFRLAENLRELGYTVQYCPVGGSLKKQMKVAEKLKCQLAIIYGEEEHLSKRITVKVLSTRTQQQMSIQDSFSALQHLLDSSD